jgi:hypothetical protein
MHGSRSKIPSKKYRQALLRGGFNSGVNRLKYVLQLFSSTSSVKGRNLPDCIGFEKIILKVVYID